MENLVTERTLTSAGCFKITVYCTTDTRNYCELLAKDPKYKGF